MEKKNNHMQIPFQQKKRDRKTHFHSGQIDVVIKPVLVQRMDEKETWWPSPEYKNKKKSQKRNVAHLNAQKHSGACTQLYTSSFLLFCLFVILFSPFKKKMQNKDSYLGSSGRTVRIITLRRSRIKQYNRPVASSTQWACHNRGVGRPGAIRSSFVFFFISSNF